MAVVHGIVERHGGVIIADGKVAQGSTFTMLFPEHEGLHELETDEPNLLPTGNGENILFVDDEPSITKLGKRHLESLGYKAETTNSPEEALERVRKDPHKYDLVVSDMAMPNMTGNNLIIEILRIHKNMPTIICTGYSANFSNEEAKEIGVNAFLMKPLIKSELATTVRKVLDGSKKSNVT